MSSPLVCLPGQRLCLSDPSHVSGQGTYERGGYIYATLAGVVDIVPKDNVQIIEVRSSGQETLVPSQGDIVTAQIHTITQQFCKCYIKCVGDKVLGRQYRGILRKEDVRATEKDRVEIYKSFRPGDVILARVLPITEAHTYQLSTAENELGVVTAHSEHGGLMVPVSWTEMQCSKTFVKEARKVARVVPESVQNDVK
ncbi:exosome complex component CSL4 [Tribolium castaneum]|uniref:Exosome complex component CSL4-like Protein n=1 Tax=Tribolium castaneum TaxID=7070 RepID=D2A4N8_TRICA|nr:PREDICTED: exosome complex component CSL4 [Tribolium castaneum]EFA05246.1 Exosome complex component CSL4-like Protein [Tribolium castaneum]|eukprot:XP_971155.1 PREDICTED: exosome complex component CSL4 [Tribolium castaneum]